MLVGTYIGCVEGVCLVIASAVVMDVFLWGAYYYCIIVEVRFFMLTEINFSSLY